eukprot:5977094-Pleurochrysis_carterae.AAC.1
MSLIFLGQSRISLITQYGLVISFPAFVVVTLFASRLEDFIHVGDLDNSRGNLALRLDLLHRRLPHNSMSELNGVCEKWITMLHSSMH